MAKHLERIFWIVSSQHLSEIRQKEPETPVGVSGSFRSLQLEKADAGGALGHRQTVGEVDDPLQPFGQGARPGGGQTGVVHDDGVALIARLEAAHLAEEGAAPLGGQVQGLGQGEGGGR